MPIGRWQVAPVGGADPWTRVPPNQDWRAAKSLAAPNYVQAQPNVVATQVSAGTTISATYGQDNDAGNLLIAWVANGVSTTAAPTVTVADSAGNTWYQIDSVADTGGRRLSLWACDQAIGGANTVTATIADATNLRQINLDIQEYDGGTSVGLLDSFGDTTVTNSAVNVGATTTAAVGNNDLIVTGIFNNGGNLIPTSPTGYTADAAGLGGAGTWNLATAHLLSTGGKIATATATWQNTNNTALADVIIVAGLKVVGTAPAQSFDQSLSVSVATTATTQSNVGKVLVPTAVALAATLAKAVGKSLSVSTTTTATIAKAVAHTFATVTISLVASVRKNVGKAVTASAVVTSATLSARLAYVRTLIASVTAAASLTSTRAFVRTLSASVSLTATLAKNVAKNLTATAVATSATLRRAVAKGLAVTVTTMVTMARAVAKPLSRSVTTTASLIAGKGYFRTLAATVTLTPALVRNVGKGLAASVAMTATAARAVTKALTVTVSLAPSLLKAIPKVLSSTMTVSAALTASRSVFRTLSASVSPSASLLAGRTLQRALSASVAVSAGLSKAVGKGLGASVATVGSIGKAIGKGLSALVRLVPFLQAQPPGIGLDAFSTGPPFVDWEVELQLSWAAHLTESWVVELEVPDWQPSPPESSWSAEVST